MINKMKQCNNCKNQIEYDRDYCNDCIKRVLLYGDKKVKINMREVILNKL